MLKPSVGVFIPYFLDLCSCLTIPLAIIKQIYSVSVCNCFCPNNPLIWIQNIPPSIVGFDHVGKPFRKVGSELQELGWALWSSDIAPEHLIQVAICLCASAGNPVKAWDWHRAPTGGIIVTLISWFRPQSFKI